MNRSKLLVLCSVLVFVATVNAAHYDVNEAVFWVGAGDGVSWMDEDNWQDDPCLPDYAIPGWIEDNPFNPGYWGLLDNKGYAVFNNGGTFTTSSLFSAGAPDGRVERLYVGGLTNTTLTLDSSIGSNLYRFYGAGDINDIGTLNMPAGGGIIEPQATDQYLCLAGVMTTNVTGGDYDCEECNTYIGYYAGSEGTVNISAGNFITGNETQGTLTLGNNGSGSIIQSGGTVVARRIYMPRPNVGASALYEISGGSVEATSFITMENGGMGVFKIIGSEATISAGRFSVQPDNGHKLELILDANGISPVNVDNPDTLAWYLYGANLQDLIIEVDAQAGVVVDVNDTFDVIISTTYVDASTLSPIVSNIQDIDFEYDVVTEDSNEILRLTAVEPQPECGDLEHPYPVMDFTGPEGVKDCVVDFYDFAEFASYWLNNTKP